MDLPKSGFLTIIVRFGEYKQGSAKDTRRVLMGIRTSGLPGYLEREMSHSKLSPNLYALIRSPQEGIRRGTGGLAIYHYKVGGKESPQTLLKHVREYIEERIQEASYLGWKDYDLLVGKWL